jgi:hypothetical protein
MVGAPGRARKVEAVTSGGVEAKRPVKDEIVVQLFL